MFGLVNFPKELQNERVRQVRQNQMQYHDIDIDQLQLI